LVVRYWLRAACGPATVMSLCTAVIFSSMRFMPSDSVS
jgi:hypothetical protein